MVTPPVVLVVTLPSVPVVLSVVSAVALAPPVPLLVELLLLAEVTLAEVLEPPLLLDADVVVLEVLEDDVGPVGPTEVAVTVESDPVLSSVSPSVSLEPIFNGGSSRIGVAQPSAKTPSGNQHARANQEGPPISGS